MSLPRLFGRCGKFGLFGTCRRVFKSDADLLREKNRENKKVQHLMSDETGRISDIAWEMLKAVPFDSLTADIIIAGYSVYGRAYDDAKYYDWHHRNTPTTPPEWRLHDERFYPHITLEDIKDRSPIDEKLEGVDITFLTSYLKRDLNDFEKRLLSVGYHALIKKDLEFDGVIAAFRTYKFDEKDWFDYTDRFDKYFLTPEANPLLKLT